MHRLPARLGRLLLAYLLVGAAPLPDSTARAQEPDARPAAAVDQPPAKAVKYHRVLLRKPAPGYLFDRFFNAWLEESTVDQLEAFLKGRVEGGGETADRLLLACFYAKRGEEVAAVEQFRLALKGDPGNAAAWLQKAELEARTLNFEGALADLDSADKALATKSDDQLQVRVAKLRGKLLLRSGQRDAALASLAKLLASSPNDEELAEDVIELQAGEGLYDEAAETTRALIERTNDPYRKVLRRLRLGDLRQQAGEREDAVAIYCDALEDVGDGSWLEREILAQVERMYRREDDIAGLGGRYEKLIEQFPQRVGVRRGYARVLADGGDTEAAVEQFREILRITPGDRDNQEAFVRLFLQAGDTAGAREQLEAIIKLNPDDGELRVQLAQLANKEDDREAAVAAVDAFLQRSDKGEYAYLRSARLLEQMEYTDEAGAKYAALTEAFPESRGAKEARAAFLYKTDQKPAAIDLWKAAAAGDNPEQAVRVARALAARQEHQAAYELLSNRAEAFNNSGLFLGQLIDEALALKKFAEAAPLCLRRVDLAETTTELDDAVVQAGKVIERGNKLAESLARLDGKATTPQRVCLLAELLERSGDIQRADDVLAPLVEQGDALAASQQVRMARGRQDWQVAIKAAQALVEMPGGRKSRNLRRLVEFHERALDFDGALRWVREWRKLSPGSTSPWLTEARLQEGSGKTEQAIATLRSALRELDDAPDIRSRLAALYKSNGQTADAESLYWRDYEEGADIVAKLRAVEQLAQIAEMEGKTDALVESFDQRRRDNRTSIEPLMSLATIYRVSSDYDKRLQALAEAAKLRPNDLDLLRQIARVEEQEGDWERARDTLRRAMPLDKTDRTKQQLASLLIRWGNPEEGYALMLDGVDDQGADPKRAEKLALAMASAGDWERVVDFLSPRVEKRPDDHRLRFLLAVSLEEIDEFTASAEQFLKVIDTEASAAPAPAPTPAAANPMGGMNSYLAELARISPPGFKEFFELQQLGQQTYAYRQQRGGGGMWAVPPPNMSGMGGGLALPPDLDATRRLAAFHLMGIAELQDETQAEGLRDAVRRSSLPQGAIIAKLGAPGRQNEVDLKELIEEFPDRLELRAAATIGWGGRDDHEPEFYRETLGLFRDKYPQLALMSVLQGVMQHKELSDLTGDLKSLVERIENPSPMTVAGLASLPMQARAMGMGEDGAGLPDDLTKAIRTKLLECYPEVRNKPPFGGYLFQVMANSLRQDDSPEALLALLEDEVAAYKPGAGSPQNPMMFGMHRGGQGTLLVTPSFPPNELWAFPPQVLAQVSRDGGGDLFDPFGGGEEPKWGNKELIEALPKVENLTLRLLLAHKAEQDELVEKAIAELLAAPKPTLDTYLLASGWAAESEKPSEAIALLEKARYLPMPRAVRKKLDSQVVALVLERKEEETATDDEVKIGQDAALRLRMAVNEPEQRSALVIAMEELGLSKEAERLEQQATPQPSGGGMAYAAPLMASSPSGGQTDRVQRLIDADKRDAAVRLLNAEVLAQVRQLAQQGFNNSYVRRQQRQIAKQVERYGMTDDLLVANAPGETTNHRRFADYASLLLTIGKREEAATAYRQALELRPREQAYRVALLMMAMEDSDQATALEHVQELTGDGLDTLTQGIQQTFNDYEIPIPTRLSWAELAMPVLEKCKEEQADLTWLTSLRAGLGGQMHTQNSHRPSLYVMQDSDEEAEQSEDAGNEGGGEEKEGEEESDGEANIDARRRALHDQVCRAMLPLKEVASDGFKGLLAVHEATGELDKEDFAKMAAGVLLRSVEKDEKGRRRRGVYHQHFYGGMHFYSSNNDEQEVPMRSPDEYLVRDCWQKKDWSLLDEQVVPKLVEAKSDLADRIAALRKLYDCEPDGFSEAVKAYAKLDARTHAAGGEPLEKSFRIYQERKLDVDLQPLLLELVKATTNGAAQVDPTQMIVEYTGTIAGRGDAEATDAWLDGVAEAMLGPLEGRAEKIAKNYNPNQIRGRTFNAACHSFSDILDSLMSSGDSVLPTVRLIDRGALGPILESNAEHYVRSGLNEAMPGDDPKKAHDFLTEAGLLGDFDALGVLWTRLGTSSSFGEQLAESATRFGNEKGDFFKLLETDEPAPLGVLMTRAWVTRKAEHVGPALEALADHTGQIDDLGQERRQAALDLLVSMTVSLERDATAKAKLSDPAKATLAWLESRQASSIDARVAKIMAAKRLEELEIGRNDLDDYLRELVARTRPDRPRGGGGGLLQDDRVVRRTPRGAAR